MFTMFKLESEAGSPSPGGPVSVSLNFGFKNPNSVNVLVWNTGCHFKPIHCYLSVTSSQCCGSALVSWRIRIRIGVRLESHKKLNFFIKIYFKSVKGRKTYLRTSKVEKPFFKGRKPGFLLISVNFQFSCSWIRIRIRFPNADPDTQHCW
jgi:hypothetical protein